MSVSVCVCVCTSSYNLIQHCVRSLWLSSLSSYAPTCFMHDAVTATETCLAQLLIALNTRISTLPKDTVWGPRAGIIYNMHIEPLRTTAFHVRSNKCKELIAQAKTSLTGFIRALDVSWFEFRFSQWFLLCVHGVHGFALLCLCCSLSHSTSGELLCG